MAKISLRGINKRFNTDVLKDINLDIGDREFVVLLGPSGCGKSTLLNIIAGLEPETSGEVYIDNVKVNALPPGERDIGFVFQNYALYPNKTVYDNLSFALKFKGINAQEFNDYRGNGNKLSKKELVDKRVRHIAEILQIQDILNAKPHHLSGGQRQRVAIGRAMVRKPKAFLLDEPLSNLDAVLRVSMRQEIRELHNKIETTSVFVTHDQIEAMTLADRIVILNDGRILQVGTPSEIYNAPANIFVAGFVGNPSMNLIEARMKELSGGQRALVFGNHEVLLPVHERYNTLPDNQKIVFGIRPENMAFVSKYKMESNLPATVFDCEYLGNMTLVQVMVDGVKLFASVNGEVKYNRGEQVNIFLDLMNIHIFDTASGKRL